MSGYPAEPVDAGFPGDFAFAAWQATVSPAPAGPQRPAGEPQPAPAPGGDPALAQILEQALAEGCGGFSQGPLNLALPMGALREVVPLTALHELPSRADGLIGAIDLRGVMLPVLDLCRRLGREAVPASHPCVVIMVHRGRLLGLLADGVTGVFAVAPDSFKRVQPPQAPVERPDAAPSSPLLAGSLRRDDDGSLVSLLSPAALAALPDMPLLDDPEPARSRQGDGQALDEVVQTLVPMMLVSAGPLVLAIDAMAVHATLAAPAVERSVLAMGACRGVVAYLGQRVPVVDLLHFTGLGRLGDDGPRELLLMHCGVDPAGVTGAAGLVGLLVEHVVDVAGVARGATVPVPGFALPVPELFAGALPLSALPDSAVALLSGHHGLQQCLVLDGPAFNASPELQALASTGVDPSAAARTHAGTAAGGAASGRRAMVTFDLAGEAAVPIEQLSEILPYRTGSGVDRGLGAAAGGGAMLGLVVDRGRSIPVLSLPRLAAVGELPADSDASVLVVQSGADWVGFAVPRLRAIEPADWEPALPAHGLGEADALTHTLRSRTLAQVGLGADQRMLRVLDLASIAQALRERRLSA